MFVENCGHRMLLLVFKADNDLLWTDRSVGILKCYLRP